MRSFMLGLAGAAMGIALFFLIRPKAEQPTAITGWTIIEGCEYIQIDRSVTYTHKGSCTNDIHKYRWLNFDNGKATNVLQHHMEVIRP